MPKRSRLSTIYDILEALSTNGGEMRATRLATYTNMAYDRLASLLEDLEKKGLVRVESEGRVKVVIITRKGLEALNRLRDMKRLLEDLGLGF